MVVKGQFVIWRVNFLPSFFVPGGLGQGESVPGPAAGVHFIRPCTRRVPRVRLPSALKPQAWREQCLVWAPELVAGWDWGPRRVALLQKCVGTRP